MAEKRNEELYQWRKSQRLTQEEAARLLDVSRGYYATLEAAHQAISKQVRRKLDEIPHQREHNRFEPGGTQMRKASLLFGEMARIQVVGKASAGEGHHNVDPDEEPIWVPMTLQRLGGIGYVVDGESMMPALQPGDVAVFREMTTPYPRFTYLVRSEQGEYRCKNLEWKNNEWTLVSLNPKYTDEPLASHQLIGLLIGWYRSVGKYEKLEANPDGLRLEGPI